MIFFYILLIFDIKVRILEFLVYIYQGGKKDHDSSYKKNHLHNQTFIILIEPSRKQQHHLSNPTRLFLFQVQNHEEVPGKNGIQ